VSLDDAGDDVGEVSERLDAVEYGATIWMRTRIASSEMLLRIDLLPHQQCSQANQRWGLDEKGQYGDTGRVD
jgi:hypothetical protein